MAEISFYVLCLAIGVHRRIQYLVPTTEGVELTVGDSEQPAIRVYKHSSDKHSDVI